MAIVEMSKMSLVAHKSERNKLMRSFIRLGCVEPVRSEEIPNTSFSDNSSLREAIDSKLVKINFALSFLKELSREASFMEKPPKVELKKIGRLVSVDDFEAVSKEEYDIFSKIHTLEEFNATLVDIKSDRQRTNSLLEQLKIYAPVDIEFSEFHDTARTAAFLGTVPTQKVSSLKESLNLEETVFEEFPSDKLTVVALVADKDSASDIRTALSAADFIKCPYEFPCLPAVKIEELKNKLREGEEKRKKTISIALDLARELSSIMTLHDYYELERAKLDVFADCAQSDKAFVLEGWVPKNRENEVKDIIEKKCPRAEVWFRSPTEEENPPTMTKNNKFTDSFENITDMFGVPNYRETDPNIFVSIFYFLIFGFMFSDAGYGILLAVACFAMYFIKKPPKKSGRMLLMFGFGGISTILWGAVFGGWFSIPNMPALINPLDGTGALVMFGLALAIGAIQIATGFAINGTAKIKNGKVLSGLLNDWSWVVIFLGLGLLVMGMLFKLSLVQSIGTYVAIAGAALLIIGGMVGKKNPIKMLGGAFGNIYGSINVVSDLLSYSRLFGLGLTTGVIGYVVNQIGVVIVDILPDSISFIGWIFACVIFLIGHIFNFAINLLGVYVHNSRLQYIEFFGRFYEGSGHAFAPLGTKTTYIYLDN